jgi:hypothetical protein
MTQNRPLGSSDVKNPDLLAAGLPQSDTSFSGQ